jgi:hypothetical protein
MRVPMARRASPPIMAAARSAPVKASGVLPDVAPAPAAAGMMTDVVAVFVPPAELGPVATKVVKAPNAAVTAAPPFIVI